MCMLRLPAPLHTSQHTSNLPPSARDSRRAALSRALFVFRCVCCADAIRMALQENMCGGGEY